MKETVGSFRIYLYVVSVLGILSNLLVMSETRLSLLDRGLGFVDLALNVVVLYLGATLPSKLRSDMGFVQGVLWTLVGLSALALAASVFHALAGTGSIQIVPIISILIGLYLLANARRLHSELNAQDTPSDAAGTPPNS